MYRYDLTTAKCTKCGGSAIADTFENARKKINHAVGLSRGIKCGDNYNMVKEIKSKDNITTKIDAGTYHKVEGKSTKNIKVDKVKPETTSSSLEKIKEKSKQTKSSVE